MTAFLFRMPAGIPGDINRLWACTVEPAPITPNGTTGAPTAYGVPLVVDNTAGNVGNMRTVEATDTTDDVYGLLVRPYPTNASADSQALGVTIPPTAGPCDVLRSGYMTVLLSGSTAAAKGGPVYVWSAAASGSHIQGGFESTNPTTSGFLLAGATFMGPADASGNVEIAFNV